MKLSAFPSLDNGQIIKYGFNAMAFYFINFVLLTPFAALTAWHNGLIELGGPGPFLLTVFVVQAYSFFIEFILCRDWPSNTGYKLNFRIYRNSIKVMFVLNSAIFFFGILILFNLQQMSFFYCVCFILYLGICLSTWWYRYGFAKEIEKHKAGFYHKKE